MQKINKQDRAKIRTKMIMHTTSHMFEESLGKVLRKSFKEFETRGHVDSDKVFQGSKIPFLTCFFQSGRTPEP